MPKPPLSMVPTGWFQVAWSDEVEVGQVHRMRYFGRDLVAWRGESGQVSVMDAYCQHLGAHLGYGGTVVGDEIQCPFHGWRWSTAGRNTCIPYEDRPNLGRRINTMPTAERHGAVLVWHDVDRRPPHFEPADLFADFEDDPAGPDDYVFVRPGSTRLWEGLELHPQYVMENGVDFAHFKYVHQTPIIPKFTRHEFDEPTAYVDFTITFDSRDEGGSIEDIGSGVNAINCGIGYAVTRSWGMIDNRTMSAVTPVDDATCDVRFSVWIGREDGVDPDRVARRAQRAGDEVIRQFAQDVEIWSHQKYASPAALSRGEYAGFTALRGWAEQFYPDSPAPATDTLDAANAADGARA